MSSKPCMQRMSSALTTGENEAYTTWLQKKNEEKLKAEQIKIYEKNRKLIEARMENEKRRLFNEICYWKWVEMKKVEYKEKKRLEEEEEQRRKEIELYEQRKRSLRDLKFNEWLTRKQEEEREKIEQMVIKKRGKDFENEMRKTEKEQAQLVWEKWLEEKQKKEREEKQKQKELEEKKTEEQKMNRKLSEERFKQWLSESSKRPRPVRSNLGFTSLSCTNISYINPKPWQSIVEETEEEDEEDDTFVSADDRVGTGYNVTECGNESVLVENESPERIPAGNKTVTISKSPVRCRTFVIRNDLTPLNPFRKFMLNKSPSSSVVLTRTAKWVEQATKKTKSKLKKQKSKKRQINHSAHELNCKVFTDKHRLEKYRSTPNFKSTLQNSNTVTRKM